MIKLLSSLAIETMVYKKSYMVEGSELQAEKWCESKPPLMAPQSRAYIASNPIPARGLPLGIKLCCDPEKKQLMKKQWWLKPRLNP
jgi:hypothetical protein